MYFRTMALYNAFFRTNVFLIKMVLKMAACVILIKVVLKCVFDC
jgi:hypothetical protein